MSHAIIRGNNGRRCEVDFEDAEITIEVHSSDETVEIVVEAVNEPTSPDRQRFALLNIPKHLFSSALGEAAQRKGTPGPQRSWTWSRNTAWRRTREVMDMAGIEGPHATPKGLRHGFGVHTLMKDIPLPLLQRWMGHANLETTTIYPQVVGNEEASFAVRLWES